ncbi:hypothetical protein ES288_D11G080200v1 [Gossypium darwinii]|uniref:Uncharacterized protein n=1 Tax=Gossypium darwinii TaxID=34276 RepID=A0A5D2AK30_GOSDA|nr:hypothetical protein ES288_D11G080200v1 [Gossypium darwinii]
MNYTVSDNKKHLKALISLDLKKLSSFVEAVIQQRVYKIWEVAIPQNCKGIMGGSWFLKLLLLSMLFILSFSQDITLFLFHVCCCCFVFLLFLSIFTLCFVFRCLGLSGKWMENHVEFREYNVQLEEFAERGREMIEIMDYKEPGPNTNPRSSYIFGPPPQPQP